MSAAPPEMGGNWGVRAGTRWCNGGGAQTKAPQRFTVAALELPRQDSNL